MNATKRFLVCLSVVALVLGYTSSIGATPPIEGRTVEFGGSSAVSGDTVDMRVVIAVDLDQDGDLDLVTGRPATEYNEVRAWQNDGAPFNGAWSTYGVQVGETGSATSALAASDLDHDGYTDLVAGGTDNNVYIFKGNNSPFAGPWTTSRDISLSSAGDVNGLAVADIDRDGNPDIISVHTSSSGNEVSVWENPYDRSTNPNIFDENWTSRNLSHSNGRTANTVAAADVDRDGYVDLVVGYNGTTGAEVVVWENTYDSSPWTFSQRNVDSSSSTVNSVAVGDLDGDGYVDVVQGSTAEEVVVWENTCDAAAWTFSEHTIASSLGDEVAQVAVADFDSDGYLDVAMGLHSGAAYEVVVYGNDADATFDWSFTGNQVGTTSADVNGLAAGDLDRDGDIDLATARDSDTGGYEIAAWQNNSVHHNATYPTERLVDGLFDGVESLDTADLDGDGDQDIIGVALLDDDLAWWENDGTPADGGWIKRIVDPNFTDGYSAYAADINGDGDVDIVGAARADSLLWWENDGTPANGGWTERTIDSSPGDARSVYAVDLDSDGDLDVLGAIFDANSVAWWENTNGSGTAWSERTVSSSFGGAFTVHAADMDNDGNMDILGAALSANDIAWWESDGTPADGGWMLHTVDADFTGAYFVRAADMDGDGKQDVLGAAYGDDDVTWWENDGSWTEHTIEGDFGGACAIHAADLDADGDLDVLGAAFESDDITWWQNDGTPGNGGWISHLIAGNFDGAHHVYAADLDADGDLDVLGVAYEEDDVAWWESQGGSAGLEVTDTSPTNIGDGVEDDLLKVVFTHLGVSGDHTLELSRFDLDLLRADCSTALTTTAASAIIDNVRVRLDDGDGVFETADTLVADVDTLSLSGGVQQISFTNDDSDCQCGPAGSKTYWISIRITSDASDQSPSSFCVNFDPDADAVVEGKSPDFSVSIQNSGATSTGSVNSTPLAVKLAEFTATADEQAVAIRLAWETATELDILGFRLDRAKTVDGVRVLLTDALVPGKNPGNPSGARYEYLDESVEPGIVYYYWLESVDVYGSATLHGPVLAAAMAQRKSYIYLPLIRR